jgi:hypothetical protein
LAYRGKFKKWPADQGSPHIARRETGARCSAFSAVPRGQNRAKIELAEQDANPD